MVFKKKLNHWKYVVSGYCSVENIHKKVTPDFKHYGSNIILLQFNEKYKKGCGILDREFNMEYLDPLPI